MTDTKKLTVLGMGSFGTALAWMLDQRGHEVTIWARDKPAVNYFNATGKNPKYLVRAKFSDRARATSDLEEALEGSEAIISVVPAQHTRQIWERAAKHGLGTDGRPVCCASKGIETSSLKTLDAVFNELFPDTKSKFAAISGPTFAQELVERRPSVAVVASEDEDCAKYFQSLFSDEHFRIYTQRDVMGVEIAGALKNVIAIATGIAVGLNLGHNGRAAIVTRGLAEITKLAIARGAQPMTMLGLAGIGDLMLTCGGPLSRNRTLGERLGRGETLADIKASTGQVAEGVDTCKAAAALAAEYKLDLPIVEQINLVLFHEKDPIEASRDLMTRTLGDELESMGVMLG